MAGELVREADDRLQRECRTFTRYLTAREPDDYVQEKYDAGQAAVLRGMTPIGAFDEQLVRFAAAGGWRVRVADAYTRILRPRCVLRRKLILLFAILENSGPYHRHFTAGGSGSSWRAGLHLLAASAGFVFALAIGIVVLAPRRLAARDSRRPGQ